VFPGPRHPNVPTSSIGGLQQPRFSGGARKTPGAAYSLVVSLHRRAQLTGGARPLGLRPAHRSGIRGVRGLLTGPAGSKAERGTAAAFNVGTDFGRHFVSPRRRNRHTRWAIGQRRDSDTRRISRHRPFVAISPTAGRGCRVASRRFKPGVGMAPSPVFPGGLVVGRQGGFGEPVGRAPEYGNAFRQKHGEAFAAQVGWDDVGQKTQTGRLRADGGPASRFHALQVGSTPPAASWWTVARGDAGQRGRTS